MDFCLFCEAVKNQNCPKQKIAQATVQDTRNKLAESDLQNKDVIKDELSTKSVRVVTEEKETKGGRSQTNAGDKLIESSSRCNK